MGRGVRPAGSADHPPRDDRIGLLGGTFDPPHVGHLWLAETAREQLGLDKVLFLPVGQPPHKQGQSITAVSHRLAMTQLALAGALHFELDTSDIDRPPPYATATLLPVIRQTYPTAQLWLLIGADSLRDLPAWIEPQRVISQCRLAVLSRPGVTVDWDGLRAAVPGVEAVVDLLDGPTLDISATEIRHWAAAGRSLRYLVPAAVLNYIHTTALYHTPTP